MSVTVIDIMGIEFAVDISPLDPLELIENKIAEVSGMMLGNFVILKEGTQLRDGEQVVPSDILELDVSLKVKSLNKLKELEVQPSSEAIHESIINKQHTVTKLLFDAQIVDNRVNLIVTTLLSNNLTSLEILHSYGFLDDLQDLVIPRYDNALCMAVRVVQDVNIFDYLLNLDCASWADADVIQKVFSKIVRFQRTDCIDPLFESGLFRSDSSTDNNSPLIEASKQGAVDIIERLLQCGFDPNFSTLQSGKTAFLAAASNTQPLETMKLLANHGANPKVRNDAGETALHVAARKGAIRECWKYLTDDIGLSLTDKDYNGFTPKMHLESFDFKCEDVVVDEQNAVNEIDEEPEEQENILPDFPDDHPHVPQELDDAVLEDADNNLYREAAIETDNNNNNNNNNNCSVM